MARMGKVLEVVVETGEPVRRFDLMTAYRLRLAVAAMILRAWHRDGAAFVTLVEVAGLLVLRPVKACAEAACGAPRLPALGWSMGLLCEKHDREAWDRGRAVEPGIGPRGGAAAVPIQRATWPVQSPEARRLLVMTLALGASYAEAPDPIGAGPGFEQRLARLREALGEVDATATLVT